MEFRNSQKINHTQKREQKEIKGNGHSLVEVGSRNRKQAIKLGRKIPYCHYYTQYNFHPNINSTQVGCGSEMIKMEKLSAVGSRGGGRRRWVWR
ncbi:hypothetical protein Csa_017651, partial [Cucumis sativus]